MPDFVTVKVEGLRELEKTLRDLGPKLARTAIRRGLTKAGDVLAAAVTEHTPVDHGVLIQSLVKLVRLSQSEGAGVVVIGFGAQGNVARLVEFGHRMVTHEGKEVGHVPAHPFMRPAFDESADEAAEVFIRTLADGVNELGKKS